MLTWVSARVHGHQFIISFQNYCTSRNTSIGFIRKLEELLDPTYFFQKTSFLFEHAFIFCVSNHNKNLCVWQVTVAYKTRMAGWPVELRTFSLKCYDRFNRKVQRNKKNLTSEKKNQKAIAVGSWDALQRGLELGFGVWLGVLTEKKIEANFICKLLMK